MRLSEIYQINEAYEWVDTTIKELLKKDFQGAEEDIAKMQQMMEESNISPKKKDAWLAFGIVLCVIFANEVDGIGMAYLGGRKPGSAHIAEHVYR